MKSQTRNLRPTKETIFAIYHWHQEYAEFGGGSMDFWDSLLPSEKEYCRRAVKAITKK